MNKEELSRFYQANKLYIFPAIVVVACLALIIFIIYPQINKFIANRQVEQEMVTKNKFLDAKVKTLQSYDLDDLKQKVDFALDSYPTNTEFVSALNLLQNLIAQAGFTIKTVTMANDSSTKSNLKTTSYSFRVDITGPLDNLSSLLSSIESSPRLLRVGEIESIAGLDPKVGTASLNVVVLYSPISASAGDVYSPLPEISQKDEEIISTLAVADQDLEASASGELGPRGKIDPFQ